MAMIAGERKKLNGFTLVELVISLVVAAILATVAVPGLQSLIANNDQATSYNQLLSGLELARSEAITRREDVTAEIEALDGGGWYLMILAADGEPLLSRNSSSDNVEVSETLTVIFNSLGRRDSCSLDNCTITISASHSEAKAIQISQAGRIGEPIDEPDEEQEEDDEGDGDEDDEDEGG